MELRQRLAQARLYYVTGGASRGRSVERTVEAALKGGVDIVQMRLKNVPDGELLALAHALRKLTSQAGALFIVNDRADLALLCGADGVHVGQDDLPPKDARSLIGPDRLMGISTHDPGQFRRAVADGADYLGVGPVYATPTKAGRQAVGLAYVREAAAIAGDIPWFAIGGIDAGNIADVAGSGARRVAVVRALSESVDPAEAARSLKARLTGL